MRVVIVTLDNHLAGAVERAGRTLRQEVAGLELSFHAAADWGERPGELERCRDDIATGDIILATMLFMDEHIQAILPALQARRERCDAMIGCMSAGEVVRLTRLGRFSMQGGTSGPMALLRRLRGSGKQGESSGAKQMAMLRRLPRILRFIPGTAQDMRAYFLTLQYWLAGSDDNVAAMVRYLVDRYAEGRRRSWRGRLKVTPPVDYPEIGLYHPALRGRTVRWGRLCVDGSVQYHRHHDGPRPQAAA